jgi:hypothetical protein
MFIGRLLVRRASNFDAWGSAVEGFAAISLAVLAFNLLGRPNSHAFSPCPAVSSRLGIW